MVILLDCKILQICQAKMGLSICCRLADNAFCMSRDKDYILDISSNPRIAQQSGGEGAAGPNGAENRSLKGRPWISVRWKCCQVYSRIYRTPDGKFYKGTCPKCGSAVQARVGEGGTNSRFFEAG